MTTLNNAREITGLVTGDVVKAHREAVAIARKAYVVHPLDDADVVISTGYPRDHDLRYSRQGFWPLASSNGSAKVLVASGDEGVGYHRLGIINARHQRQAEDRERENLGVPQKSETPDYLLFSQTVGPAEVRDIHPQAELVETWDSAREILEDQFRGQTPKVAVYPSSAIAYPANA